MCVVRMKGATNNIHRTCPTLCKPLTMLKCTKTEPQPHNTVLRTTNAVIIYYQYTPIRCLKYKCLYQH